MLWYILTILFNLRGKRYMKLTLWSAGENGNTAKKYIAFSILTLILWFAAAISIANGGHYIEYPEFDKR